MTMTSVTTPFGRRPASLGQVVAGLRFAEDLRQARIDGDNRPAAIDKWKLFRTITVAKPALDLSDRSLGLLQALLSFHPETALTLPEPDADGVVTHDLVVFPSNRQLAARAHGMAEKTIRRHLAALVEAGLILRRDSPNGKRYARRAEDEGERFSEIYGFDLTPLVLRAPEFEDLAEGLRRAERRQRVLREKITLLRRDIAKLVAMALDEQLPGDWEGLRLRFLVGIRPLRRLEDEAALEAAAARLSELRQEAEVLLADTVQFKDMTGNGGNFDRQISTSNTEVTEIFEPAAKPARDDAPSSLETKAFSSDVAPERCPAGLVREACPDMVDYAPNGRVRDWPDILAAARVIRPMLGISPDAWAEAVGAMGEPQAAATAVLILQRSEFSSEAETTDEPDGTKLTRVNFSPAIRSPGGYLRALTEKARTGDFALGPILMATIGQRLKAKRGSAAAKS